MEKGESYLGEDFDAKLNNGGPEIASDLRPNIKETSSDKKDKEIESVADVAKSVIVRERGGREKESEREGGRERGREGEGERERGGEGRSERVSSAIHT